VFDLGAEVAVRLRHTLYTELRSIHRLPWRTHLGGIGNGAWCDLQIHDSHGGPRLRGRIGTESRLWYFEDLSDLPDSCRGDTPMHVGRLPVHKQPFLDQ